jgi:hypothetical protein
LYLAPTLALYRFLKAEELYGLCRRALAYAHTVPYAETAVTTLEGLTEAILDKTAVLCVTCSPEWLLLKLQLQYC